MRDWVEGRVVRVVEGDLGINRVGLQFLEPCPQVFFRRAIWGGLASDAAASADGAQPEPTNPASCWSLRRSRSVERILAACTGEDEVTEILGDPAKGPAGFARAI